MGLVCLVMESFPQKHLDWQKADHRKHQSSVKQTGYDPFLDSLFHLKTKVKPIHRRVII